MLLLSISLSAQAQDFGQRMEAGKPRNLAANESRYYQSVAIAIRDSFNFDKCWPEAKEGDRMELKIAADVVVAGATPILARLENVAVEPDSSVSRCYIEQIGRISLPPPPRSPLPFASIFAIVKN